jgi:hypothetical protein
MLKPHLELVTASIREDIVDGLGNTSEMKVTTQRLGMDLASPMKQLFRIHGASDVIAATQRLQSKRILQWQEIHRHAVTYETSWTTETKLLSSHSNAIC